LRDDTRADKVVTVVVGGVDVRIYSTNHQNSYKKGGSVISPNADEKDKHVSKNVVVMIYCHLNKT
jgi:hypothetical protein